MLQRLRDNISLFFEVLTCERNLKEILRRNCNLIDGCYLSKIDRSIVGYKDKEHEILFLAVFDITEQIHAIDSRFANIGYNQNAELWYAWVHDRFNRIAFIDAYKYENKAREFLKMMKWRCPVCGYLISDTY